MQPVPFTTRELADGLLLVRALEVEAGHVGARVDLLAAHHDVVGATGDLLEHRLVPVE